MIKKRGDTKTLAGVVAYCALLGAYCLYDLVGLVVRDGVMPTLFVVGAFVPLIGACAFRHPIEAFVERHRRSCRPLVYAVVVLSSLFVLERPYGGLMGDMPPSFALVNLCILTVFFGIVFFAGQRTKAASIGFLVACFLVGLANYFVVLFKGQPILPADLFVLETALAVSRGYTYVIDGAVAQAFTVLAFAALLVSFLPKEPQPGRRPRPGSRPEPRPGRRPVLVNLGASLACILAFCLWFAHYDLKEAYDIKIDPWYAQQSYARQGSLLCFLQQYQGSAPPVPQGYSPEEAAGIRAAFARPADNAMAEGGPTVVVVMNESFVDLSGLGILSDRYGGPTYYQSVAEDALSGTAYVSAYGGSTCNSEFEFLTGSSLGNIGTGIYPYVRYNLSAADSLVSYFKGLDYETIAIHPAQRTNWRRHIVYATFGFDRFLDIDDFPDARTFRDKTTDKETYRKILDLVRESDAPQFIFDITYQNHGGYDTGLVPDGARIRVPIEGNADSALSNELDEFLSCIHQSDLDLRYLIEGLEAIDKDIVLCFFGDHHPGFSAALAQLEFGKELADFTLDEVQTYYCVPYMIWKNYGGPDAGAAGAGGADTDTSLNYLGAILVQEAGLPLTAYQRFLLDTRIQMPAINLNGYQDASRTWYWIGEESDISSLFHTYAVLQHDNLFNRTKAP
ncbi:MAG: LTA synthase family protein [Coriobacteriaceae bacterium]|jgi:phosphoglycerol transferase MdoB-like AlkP superfamily enzyme|nr:LTA synthase family protein [Coriobacteriaceae bacterium]